MSSLKCAQCGLVNFATSEVCKRCANTLIKAEPQSDQSAPEQKQNTQTETQAVQISNLMPCPDCAHLCSHMAAACPNCGRVLQHPQKPIRSILRPVIVVGVFAVLCAFAIGIYFMMQRQVAVEAAVQSGNPANAGVSSGNRDAARAALNAIGEVQSVTSIGTNYMQYSAALQSAKIKFDAAMRDYKPRDEADDKISRDLEAAFDAYVAARDVWSAFIESGERYCMKADKVSSIVARYDLAVSDGDICEEVALQSLWEKASKSINDVSTRLR